MKFWIFLALGAVCVIITRIIIHSNGITKISELKPSKQLLAIIFALLAVSLVGGIIVGDFVATTLFEDTEDMLAIDYVFFGIVSIVGACFTYLIGSGVLGLYYFDKKAYQIYFLVLFIVSIFLWCSEIVKYDNNIVTNTETIVVSEAKRELIQFEGIYIQKVSNPNDNNSKNKDSKNSEKDLTGDDKVSYWYINKSGKGQYNSVSAKSSKIEFIKDDETPYIKVVKKCKQSVTINNNNGKETTEKEKEWDEYYFYVPESIFK